jgi:hypothetical protein
MAYKSYKRKSEVAHHGSKALSEGITTAFKALLALLATLRTLKAAKELLKLIDIKIIVSVGLASRNRRSGHLIDQSTLKKL